MNGVHDMGGRLGFGSVSPEANEPVFHAVWEGRVYGLAGALGSFDLWNLDEDRHACESHPPATYVSSSYYEIWLMMLERMLVQKGVASQTELASGRSETGQTVQPRLRARDVMAAQLAPGSYHRETREEPVFKVGDPVRVRNVMTTAHTRLPGYLRGVSGTIAAIHGNHVFPDSHAAGKGEDPKWLYGVRFQMEQIWGQSSRDTLQADMWEPYLEHA